MRTNGETHPLTLTPSVVETLRRCQHPDGLWGNDTRRPRTVITNPLSRPLKLHPGGFGGGPGQLAHLAPTYAAVNALAIVGTEEAYGIIDRLARGGIFYYFFYPEIACL